MKITQAYAPTSADDEEDIAIYYKDVEAAIELYQT